MPFTQKELEEAYAQMQADRKADSKLAALAAKKLSQALGGQRIGYRLAHYGASHDVTPDHKIYELWFEMSQYDGLPLNFNNVVNNYAKRMIVGRGQTWCGEYDLSNDPDFAVAHQKVYRVAIDTYDAHCCGF